MKINNREKVMLFVLGIILIVFGYYNFVYSVQATAIEGKVKEENEVKEKYEIAMATINSLENKENDVKLLKEKIEEESKPFYPIISEEHIILEIDKLLKDSELKGTMKFDPMVCDAVENVDKKSETLPNSTLQQIVDKYNGKNTSNTAESSTNATTNNNNNSNGKSDSNSNNSKDSKDTKKDTVQYIKFQVNFEGSYDGIYKFLSAIGENDRKIVVNSIKLSSDTSLVIKGTVNLEIYSIPKIDDNISQYLKWNLTNSYGKDIPFSADTEGVSSISRGTNAKETSKTSVGSDFLASVKSMTSDLPKIIIGKAKDDLRTTYVYGDNNSEEKAEMIFTQDGDKYYYKYKTSKETFPASYDGPGEEFIPMSKDIVLGIMSESRVNANDNSALRLNIINKTDKIVDVNISGDDSTNPRVTIEGNSDNVKVN